MQAQLPSFSALPNFLHPACWPDYPCLLVASIKDLATLDERSVFQTAGQKVLRVSSLQDLTVQLPDLPSLLSAEAQCHVSGLTTLTKLHISTDASTAPYVQALWDHTRALTSLQHLAICWHSSYTASKATGAFSIPTTWAALSRLSTLSLLHAHVTNPEGLLPMAALRTLRMLCAAQQLPQVVECVAQLALLTALTVLEYEGELPDAAGIAPSHVSCSSSSSSTLQVLDLSCPNLAEVPLQQLPCLTSLVYHGPWKRPSLFPGGRVRPLASLKLLQLLDLDHVMLTQDFCWYELSSVTCTLMSRPCIANTTVELHL
jgi:hypothetical protein